ncbi:hypothetical protein TNCV_4419851 [Trichonephila clavipes]|nr:hypothetical protein TNCV_4419851 [Trichonephila clavipes]
MVQMKARQKKLKDLSKALESEVFMNRQSQSSDIGPQGPPSNLEGASRFALQFPTLVKNTGDGKVSPLELELTDLHTVTPNFTEYKTNPKVPLNNVTFNIYPFCQLNSNNSLVVVLL